MILTIFFLSIISYNFYSITSQPKKRTREIYEISTTNHIGHHTQIPLDLQKQIILYLCQSESCYQAYNNLSALACTNRYYNSLLSNPTFKKKLAQLIIRIPSSLAEKKYLAQVLKIKEKAWYKIYIHQVKSFVYALGKNTFVDRVTSLVKAKADVNVTDDYGKTALMHACLRAHAPLVKILLSSGASINARAHNGCSALTYLMHNLLLRNCLEVTKILLEAGVDVNNAESDGWTALMYACKSGNIEIIRLLVNAGAEVDMQNNIGNTALMLAACYNHRDAVTALLAAGANSTIKNKYHQTALDMAIARNYTAIKEILQFTYTWLTRRKRLADYNK